MVVVVGMEQHRHNGDSISSGIDNMEVIEVPWGWRLRWYF